MAMSQEDEIPKWKQELFAKNIIQGLQQKGSKLRDKVVVGSYEGLKAEAVKRLGQTEAEDDDDRNGDTPIMSTPRESVWLKPRKFHWGDLFDDQDIQEQLVDPSSPIVQAGVMSMGRKLDRGRIIPSLFAPMMQGAHGELTTVFPADASQDILNTVGSADGATATGMNVDKWIDALTLLIGNEADPLSKQVHCAMNYLELRQLMKDPKFVGREYRSQQVYDNLGMLTAFMGVQITIINDKKGVPGSGLPLAAGIRSCGMWLQECMNLGLWQDVMVKIQRDPTKQYKWRPYISCHAGATRNDNLGVVRIFCKES
jgi:hypothetical protein